jgi:hypothetical protein
VAKAARRIDPRAARAAAVSDLGEVLRRDRTPTVIADPKARGDGITALGHGVHRALCPCRRSANDGLTDWLLKPSNTRPDMRRGMAANRAVRAQPDHLAVVIKSGAALAAIVAPAPILE